MILELGYVDHSHPLSDWITVHLDGAQLPTAFAAHDREGWVKYMEEDPEERARQRQMEANGYSYSVAATYGPPPSTPTPPPLQGVVPAAQIMTGVPMREVRREGKVVFDVDTAAVPDATMRAFERAYHGGGTERNTDFEVIRLKKRRVTRHL